MSYFRFDQDRDSGIHQRLLEGLEKSDTGSGTFDQYLKAGPFGQLGRVASVDVLRGFAIVLMLLVNNSEESFRILAYSSWDGLTLADMVMPLFLFVVGVSLVLSIGRRREKGVTKGAILRKAAIRSVKLFLLGIFLDGARFPHYDVNTIRIMGVLQRIAIDYFIAVVIILYIPSNKEMNMHFIEGRFQILFNYFAQWLMGLMFTIVYLLFLFGLNNPDCGRRSLSADCNAVGYIDLQIFTSNHMDKHPSCLSAHPPCKYFEPEGLLSTVSSTFSVFVGIYYAYIFVAFQKHEYRFFNWAIAAFVMLGLGLPLHFFAIPMNKNLYSFSYSLITGAISGMFLCFTYLLVELMKLRRLTYPFLWTGMNAILVYFGDIFVPCILGSRWKEEDAWFYFKEPSRNFGRWAYVTIFERPMGVPWCNFTWGIAHVLFWTCIAGVLYYKKIFFKI